MEPVIIFFCRSHPLGTEAIDNNESRNTRPCHHQDLRHNGRSSQGTPAFFVSPSTRLLFSNCFLVLFLSSFVSVAVCFLLSSSVSYISSYAWLCSCIFPMFVCLFVRNAACTCVMCVSPVVNISTDIYPFSKKNK